MKMQEVITKLREEAPLLEKSSKGADDAFQKVRRLFVDFRRAESVEGQGILADAVVAAFIEFEGEYRTLRCSIETVCMVNAEYKEKIGPRTKKTKDAEGQLMLPGLGDEGCTSTVIDRTPGTMVGTSTSMQSGRHG